MFLGTQREDVLDRLESLLDASFEKHGCNSWRRHEFYGILKEEFEELWDEIRKRGSTEDLHLEILHVALVCIRHLEVGEASSA